MASAVKTSVTELPDSRVRVQAEVPAEEVERRIQETARALGRELKMPGFRKGKVPPPVVIRRVGRDAVLDETVRGSLGSWYANAIDDAGIVPVGDPQLALDDMPGEGESLTFSIEIGVRPKAQLGSYRELEVGRREPDASDEAIEGELEALRERLAKLETADGPAAQGDFVVIDYAGSVDGEPLAGAEGRAELVELGAGRLIEGMEKQLVGAKAGEEREVDVDFPEEYESKEVAGKTAVFTVSVKEVKRKQLPPVDDDLASDAAGFDTLDELRADIREKLLEADRQRIESEFREAGVDAAVAEAKVDVPDDLVTARAAELWEQLTTTLARQGVSQEAYLRIAGKTEDQIVDEAKPDAAQALKREAVLAAIVEAEGIEPGDDDVREALAQSAASAADAGGATPASPEELLERVRKAGRLEALRADLAIRQAVDLIASSAKPIAAERAQAREKLWRPGKEEEGEAPGQTGQGAAPGKLWTPGS
jgi:trigger factor